jgi:hypothetical protein
MAMSERGFYLVSRGMLDHPRYKPRGPFTQFEAWHWLIESAAYAPRDVPIMTGTRREIITLQPGQLSHSIRFLSAAWRWSPNRVQRFLRDLAMDGSVTTQTDTAQTVITLCNWDKYQRPFSEANTQADTQTDTQTDTKKKEIKEKKDRALQSEPEGFQDWYAIYPNKKQPQAAKRAFAKVIRSRLIALPALMEKTKAFATSWAAKPKEERRFIPYPARWLNDGSYDDEPDGGEPAPVIRDPRSFSDADWQKRLKYFQDSETWMPAWGPKPGEPGCLVPSHLLLTPVSNSKGAA